MLSFVLVVIDLSKQLTSALLALQGIQKMQKERASEAQIKADSSRRRTEGPAVPKTLSGRPNDTLLTLEQDKSEVNSGTRL